MYTILNESAESIDTRSEKFPSLRSMKLIEILIRVTSRNKTEINEQNNDKINAENKIKIHGNKEVALGKINGSVIRNK